MKCMQGRRFQVHFQVQIVSRMLPFAVTFGWEIFARKILVFVLDVRQEQ